MIRPPAVAGQFYPEEKKELEKNVSFLLSRAEAPEIKGEIFGLLSPHAGYVFSGQVAACGYKALAGRDFDTVILMGDSHYERFEGVSFWSSGKWETPLGKVEVDEQLVEKITSFSKRFYSRDSAHIFEHSLEVQLPFLQKTLKKFKILPIVFGSEDEDWESLAQALLGNIGRKKTLIVASSDLSHYLPYGEAVKKDKRTLEAVLGGNYTSLEACGKDSLKTLMKVSESLKGQAHLLKYANSGDVEAGDKNRVVGYGSVAFHR